MTRLAILILKSANDALFEATLASVLANRPAAAEVCVVCPGGYDDPYELSDEVHFVESPAEEWGAGRLLNVGLEHLPECDVLHVLQSGLVVDEGWVDGALRRFEDPDVAAVAPLVLRPNGRIEAAGMKLASTGAFKPGYAGARATRKLPETIVGPSIQAAFYRFDLLRESSGVDRVYQDWLGDADLALTLCRDGKRAELAADSHVVGELAWRAEVSGLREGQLQERFFWTHGKTWGKVIAHPVAVGIDCLLDVTRRRSLAGVFGRLAGMAAAPFDLWRGRQGGANLPDETVLETAPPQADWYVDKPAA